MKKIRLWGIPAVRKKLLADWAFIAALLAPCIVILSWGKRLAPTAQPWAAAILLAVVVASGIVHSLRACAYVERSSDLVTSRMQAEKFWDLVQAYAARLRMPAPRVFVLRRFRQNYAMAWGTGNMRSVGVNREVLAMFTDDMLTASVAHEMSHLRLGDTRFSQIIRAVAAFLNYGAILLFLAGMAAMLGSTPMSFKIVGLEGCFVAAFAWLWLRALAAWVLPWLLHWQEYAADQLGIALTDNPEGMIKVMLHATLETKNVRRTVRPRSDDDGPTPMTRILHILRAHPDALSRRP